jgi:hypothetical protein
MNNEQVLAFLNAAKSGKIAELLESKKAERIASLMDGLTSPMKTEADVLNHARLGGEIEGLRFDVIQAVIDELEHEEKPIREN